MYRVYIHDHHENEIVFKDYDLDFNEYWWSDGNMACDGNRHHAVCQVKGILAPEHQCLYLGYPGGRFTVRIFDKDDNQLYYDGK